MSGKARILGACSFSVFLGLAASVLCVLARRSIPLPRWDLILSLSLALAGLVGCLAIARRASDSGPAELRTSRYWWPSRRTGLLGFGMWAWFLPAFFVVSAAFVPSGQAWRIAEAGETIRPVIVEEVLKSEHVQSGKTSHYSNEVRVSVPFEVGPRIVEGRYSSRSAVGVGDQIYVLYSPSSPGLGALIDSSRSDLEREIGGLASVVEILLVLMYVGLFGWFYSLIGLRPRPEKAIADSFRRGNVRRLPGAVDQVGVMLDERPVNGSKRKHPKPCVRLILRDGEYLNLYLDQVINPMSLVSLEGTQVDLYWTPPRQKLPYGASVGVAVLVWNDRRCLPGWVATSDGSELPHGEVVAKLPEGPELQAMHPAPLRDPDLYVPAIGAILPGVLALLVVSLGVGNFATVVLAALAFLSPFVAKRTFRTRLTRKLHSISRAMSDPEGQARA